VLMLSDVKTQAREVCNSQDEFPFATFCSGQSAAQLDTGCVSEVGSGVVIGELTVRTVKGIVSKADCNSTESGIMQYTDVSQHFYWIWLSHVDETLKMIDNSLVKHIVLSTLDLVAYYMNNPKIADDFEIIKILF